MFIYDIACNALYLRFKRVLFICPITYPHKQGYCLKSHLFKPNVYIIYIMRIHIRTYIAIYL